MPQDHNGLWLSVRRYRQGCIDWWYESMPFVRERIGSQLGIRVDFDVDPMTAVGVGAAVYAESRDWSGTSAQPKKLRASTKTSGPIDIRFDYPSRTTEPAIRIKVGSNAPIEENALRIQVDTDCGWTSGQLPLAATSEITGVLLARTGSTAVRVSVFDEFGNIKEDCGASSQSSKRVLLRMECH